MKQNFLSKQYEGMGYESTPPAPDTTAEGILKPERDFLFQAALEFGNEMYKIGHDYANQKQIPLSAFDKFKVSGPHQEENPFYTLRKTDLEGIIGKAPVTTVNPDNDDMR